MRALAAPVAAVVAACLTTLGVAAPAAGAEVWRVPRSAAITVDGHGYGHGHGMSQHGAQGAAQQGLDHRQILEFYYPGTTWGLVRGRIDVLLTADTTDDLVVRTGEGLRVTDLGSGEVRELPAKDTDRWRTTVGKDGRTVVAWLDGQTWRRWRTLAGLGAFSTRAGPTTLVTPAGERSYRGRLVATPLTDDSTARATVNTLKLEQYLRGVVPLEMPALWEPEAVRAQAVAARTYAAYERRHPRGSWFDVYDTTQSQVYGGATAEHPGSDAAVRATRRQILRYDGEPAFTQFSASSGGWTSAGSAPYLVAQEDPYDDWKHNSHHDWSVEVTDKTFERRWPALGNLRRIRVVSRDGNGEWGGRVTTLRLVGSRSRVTVSGDTMRSVLGLKSTWVTFRVE